MSYPIQPNSLRNLLVLLVTVILAACAAPAVTQPPPPRVARSAVSTPTVGASPAPVAVAQSSKPRLSAPSVAATQRDALAAGNSAFAFDLYQAIRASKGNLFYSPYSISLALAMTFAGARGTTEQQMAQTLHFTLPQAQLHPAFNALDLQLTSAKDFRLNIANSLWGQTGFPFRPEFLDTLAENYGAGLRLVDFVRDGPREQARQTINQWVDEKTEGKIKELLEKDILSERTRLVLVNAIYFKADWDVPFTRGTRNGSFHLASGEQITVPLMSRRALTNYAKGNDYEAVEIAYKGNRASMIAVLPAVGQFDAFEKSVSAERVTGIVRALRGGEVLLTMPKFRYEASFNLAQTLSQMGMSDAFAPERADLSGMTGTRDLFIKEVVHKAFVAVDELGTEAAAATGVVTELTSMPTAVTLDRPFLFIIRDGESGTILFVGRVLDPRK